ncbi:hypothetical protein DQ244_11620 [Blastococcus sp. TBT05-19]|uniref:maleylpyruvate isomerase N-terminal domain-containing protein n=1 Tax=Blastococcus sp. TBT05-19 TaxID=2250581 RepID=UPI000DE8164A|nr:hypothetical protein DQ244_11620 [Blastococcus sp. TBT05-19]
MRAVDTFAHIADERRGLAALLSGLTDEQQVTQSLCSAWTVHDVVAHLVVPLEVSTPRFVLAMLACRGNFDRANVRVAREQARRPFGELLDVLDGRPARGSPRPGRAPRRRSPICWCTAWTSACRWACRARSPRSACARRWPSLPPAASAASAR